MAKIKFDVLNRKGQYITAGKYDLPGEDLQTTKVHAVIWVTEQLRNDGISISNVQEIMEGDE